MVIIVILITTDFFFLKKTIVEAAYIYVCGDTLTKSH